eukprot:TRINITY_DN42970_c0_g1_i1.p1 TRINITY_DN42970_c0_g1~~TRINITY_DN42970_c0_g1_i1.p1  ORF type:complete len:637 (+),score=81.16 TRINITY_DN42970_c0_g1_i1:115-2025(+)
MPPTESYSFQALVQNYELRVPIFPVLQNGQVVSSDVTGGLVGLATDSVLLQNGHFSEHGARKRIVDSFDPCGGHVDAKGRYHYHLPPVCLLQQQGVDLENVGSRNANNTSPKLLGIAMDGFPIMAAENIDPTTLDECNGRADSGQYRYFMRSTAPFFPACFRGSVIGSLVSTTRKAQRRLCDRQGQSKAFVQIDGTLVMTLTPDSSGLWQGSGCPRKRLKLGDPKALPKWLQVSKSEWLQAAGRRASGNCSASSTSLCCSSADACCSICCSGTGAHCCSDACEMNVSCTSNGGTCEAACGECGHACGWYGLIPESAQWAILIGASLPGFLLLAAIAYYMIRKRRAVFYVMLVWSYLMIPAVVMALQEGWTPVQGFYWGMQVMTTIGYGELNSHSDRFLKLFSCFYICAALAIVVAGYYEVSSLVTNAARENLEKRLIERIERSSSRISTLASGTVTGGCCSVSQHCKRAILYCTVNACFTAASTWYWMHRLSQRQDIPATWVDGLYFTIVTVSTVGFGDIVPVGVEECLVFFLTVVVGLPLFGAATSSVSDVIFEAFTGGSAQEREQRKDEELSKRIRRIVTQDDIGSVANDASLHEVEVPQIEEAAKNATVRIPAEASHNEKFQRLEGFGTIAQL